MLSLRSKSVNYRFYYFNSLPSCPLQYSSIISRKWTDDVPPAVPEFDFRTWCTFTFWKDDVLPCFVYTYFLVAHGLYISYNKPLQCIWRKILRVIFGNKKLHLECWTRHENDLTKLSMYDVTEKSNIVKSQVKLYVCLCMNIICWSFFGAMNRTGVCLSSQLFQLRNYFACSDFICYFC